MSIPDSFINEIKLCYFASSDTMCLGGILYDGQLIHDPKLNISCKSINRHGLISGATGTGKTKTIQVLSEQLANHGVPILLMDIKGDLSGLAMPGEVNDDILHRQKMLGIDYIPRAYPVELLSMGSQPGVQVRETLLEFKALLFAKMLNLNETQTSIISILFQYASDNNLLLLDLSDIKQLISHAQGKEKSVIESGYGGLSRVSLKSILRSIIELESQGGGQLFGEPSFDVHDLIRLDPNGVGIISILRLIDMQDKPKLFSTFMLGLLSSVYSIFPEIGDPDKPRLVIFIDEAHLIFSQASKALLAQLENMVKLIRSKGIGLIFCTQSPRDIPEGILSQLGLKIQHALRAFTVKDRKAIKLIAENFPPTPFYDTAYLLTSLGIGKALVSALDVHGQPTPLVEVMIRAPQSRMGSLRDSEISQLTAGSSLVKKYDVRLERESAMEKLKERQAASQKKVDNSKNKLSLGKISTIEALSKNTLVRQVIRSIAREVVKAFMLALGFTKSKGKKK